MSVALAVALYMLAGPLLGLIVSLLDVPSKAWSWPSWRVWVVMATLWPLVLWSEKVWPAIVKWAKEE